MVPGILFLYYFIRSVNFGEEGYSYSIGGDMKTKDLGSIINDFLNNIDQYEDDVLEAIAHLVEVELKERDFVRNPQNFPGSEYDN